MNKGKKNRLNFKYLTDLIAHLRFIGCYTFNQINNKQQDTIHLLCMTYQQTIDYLFSTLPMFSRIGSAAYKKDLTNIAILCEHLHNPHQKFKSVHIGGTNGKGSVSHMLAAVLQTAGYKTGLYTSPHLKDFRERIKINGIMVEKGFVIDFVEKIKPVIEEIHPSFFEITVAMAFDYFAQQKIDIAIVEVGLGGRLDSTNIIMPELSVITNIGWDHMNILGNSLEEIAIEKGGIIKPGIPVVIGEKKEVTAPIFRTIAKERKAPIFFSEENFTVTDYTIDVQHINIAVKDFHNNETKDFKLDLPGIYQTKNILTVLQALQILKNKAWNMDDHMVAAALSQVKNLTGLHGRWEVIHQNPTVVLEVAHNADGVQQMTYHLQQLHYYHLHIVLGTVKDKDVQSILSLLPQKATYYFTAAHIPRALDAAFLRDIAAGYGLKGNTYSDVDAALKSAMDKASGDDLIIVCGSIFLVAEVDIKLV